jgi:hypothetical protein
MDIPEATDCAEFIGRLGVLIAFAGCDVPYTEDPIPPFISDRK